MSLSRMFWLDVLVVHLFSKQPTENKKYCPNHMQASNKKRISNAINVLYKNKGSEIFCNMQLQIYSFSDVNKLQCLFFCHHIKLQYEFLNIDIIVQKMNMFLLNLKLNLPFWPKRREHIWQMSWMEWEDWKTSLTCNFKNQRLIITL